MVHQVKRALLKATLGSLSTEPTKRMLLSGMGDHRHMPRGGIRKRTTEAAALSLRSEK